MTYTSILPRILQTGAGASAQIPQILASLGCQRYRGLLDASRFARAKSTPRYADNGETHEGK